MHLLRRMLCILARLSAHVDGSPILRFEPDQACLQRPASSNSDILDPYSMMEFIANRLNGVENCDWMACFPALKKGTLTSNLAMPQLVEVVANYVRV